MRPHLVLLSLFLGVWFLLFVITYSVIDNHFHAAALAHITESIPPPQFVQSEPFDLSLAPRRATAMATPNVVTGTYYQCVTNNTGTTCTSFAR